MKNTQIDDSKIRYDKIINEDDFILGVDYLRCIHEKLFTGIYDFAGKFRNTNMTKKEVILNGDSVAYSDCRMILQDLVNAILLQYKLDYSSMNMEEVVKNISVFTANIWKTHPFIDGNTRTVYLYVHKYLKSLGFNIDIDIFNNNSTYFRNALVKAIYENDEFYIKPDINALENFFRKCLIDNSIRLDLNDVYIDGIVKLRNDIKR